MFRKARNICRKNVCFLPVIITLFATIVYAGITAIAVLDSINQSNMMLEKLGYQIVSNECKLESIMKYVFRKASIGFSSADRPLHFIPEPWEIDNQAPYLDYTIVKDYLETPKIEYKKVAILTLIRNSEKVLGYYGHEVAKLNYPHEFVSVYLGDSGSTDNTIRASIRLTRTLKSLNGFKDADVYLMNENENLQVSLTLHNEQEFQLLQWSQTALARNTLLEAALRKDDFEYILWVDSDIEELPPDIIQHMLFAKSDVVTTPCYLWQNKCKKIFDRRAWKETKESPNSRSMLVNDRLVLKGKTPDVRLYLHQMLSLGRVVPLDSVGGCALMVRAACFQKGLRFPEKAYKNHLDTEGIAKMALDMNFTVFGLPFLDVFHRDSMVH